MEFLTQEWDTVTGLLPDRAVNLLKDLLAKAVACYKRVEPASYAQAYG